MSFSLKENINYQIINPIKLNCWKHHLSFIKNQLPRLKTLAKKEIGKALLKIGNSQMDLYLGKLSPKRISLQINAVLKNNKIHNHTAFNLRLKEDGKQYCTLALSDRSVWVLRKGNDAARFVHIHPGRYSPHTIRIKSYTLKTAILFCALPGEDQLNKKEMAEAINYLRKKYLDAPPLKDINNSTSLIKLIGLLSD